MFCWVVVWIKIFTFPVRSNKPTCFLKIGRKVNVFFLTKNFSFNSCACLRPLVQNLFRLFISSFLLKFSILMFKPNMLKFLFNYVVRWIVVEVIRATFKSVLGFELNWFLTTCCLIGCIKRVKRLDSHGFFRLIEGRNV